MGIASQMPKMLQDAGSTLAPLLKVNVGTGVLKAAEWAVVKYGVSGTGRRIADTWGIAKSDAVKTVFGLGSKANGGLGRDFGVKVMRGIVFAGNAGFTIVGVTIMHLRSKLIAQGEDIASCVKCRTLLSATKNGDLQDCPNCAPGGPAGN